MPDMNPFFGMGQVRQSEVPDYLKQQALPQGSGVNGAITNGAANMLKALLAGKGQPRMSEINQMQRMQQGQTMQNPQTQGQYFAPPMAAPTPTPTSPVMPTNPVSMTGAQQPPVPMPQPSPAFDAGAAPVPMGGVDPMTAALFSQIPGVNGG